MCEAHSKVSHIKQQKYFHHLKGCGYNKCIKDDTKATAHQSPNCIKKQKIK